MHSVIYILLVAGATMAHYHSYESKNLIEREEPHVDNMDSLVECPVCEMPQNQEDCDIIKGNKRFKKCHGDTYFNEKCGNRLDCYRGPGETCTEKMENDIYGKKCAHGCYCDGAVHQCVCIGYKPPTGLLQILRPTLYRYPLGLDESDKRMVLLA